MVKGAKVGWCVRSHTVDERSVTTLVWSEQQFCAAVGDRGCCLKVQVKQ